MKSYRSRFQRIYDQCMCLNASTFLGIEQVPQFPQLQKWLGLTAVDAVEMGHIVDPPVIHTATSIVPLGWNGTPADKNSDPLKVDIVGHGLHVCTLVQAQVNGNWCSTVVESIPTVPPPTADHCIQPDLQKMRILIGPPLKQPPKYPVLEESLHPMFSSDEAVHVSSNSECDISGLVEDKKLCSPGLHGFIIYCTSDFITVSKKVHIRTRRVRLLGFEGAGKTSLFKAIVDHGGQRNKPKFGGLHPEVDTHEAIVDGVCYVDSAGLTLQELQLKSTQFREDMHTGLSDLSKKTDLIILVHDLSQKICWYHQSQTSQPRPALSILLDEAKALSVPWVLAITNKFSVSAHQQKTLVKDAMDAYEASPNMTEVVNSCPFVMPSATTSLRAPALVDDLSKMESAQRLLQAPLMLARIPFQRKENVLPVQGITAFRQLVHRVLRSQEEIAFEELANERLSIELAREQERALSTRQDSEGKGSSITAAAIGASLGAGLGIVLAVVMGAASALRKP